MGIELFLIKNSNYPQMYERRQKYAFSIEYIMQDTNNCTVTKQVKKTEDVSLVNTSRSTPNST